MNVYLGGAAKLAGAMAADGVLPPWLAAGAPRTVPLRPLAVIAAAGVTLLAGLVAGVSSTEDLVRATSALFIAVYVLAIVSAVRILEGRVRVAAISALALVAVPAIFSAVYLVVPAVAAAASLLLRRRPQRSLMPAAG
jgi:amino acid efflux transporter